MWIWFLSLSSTVVISAVVAWAAPLPSTNGSSAQGLSTTVTSQRMTFKNQDSQAVFDGSVVLRRGSLIVYSDKMVVLFREQGSAVQERKKLEQVGAGPHDAKGPDTVSNRAVSKIEATGRVKIEREAGNATCQKAVYYRDEDKIVLTGEPVAWDKGTRVSGTKITLFLSEDRTVVEGGSHVRIESEGGAK
jgi:lipopolysaccharide export system protein LptA